MKMKSILIGITVALATIALSGCGQTKTVDYFHQHPEEIQPEAKRCITDAGNNKNITKDKTCMNVVAVEKERCEQQMRISGNLFGVDCDNGPGMMSLAYHGY